MKLVDRFGKYHKIELIGIKKLSSNLSGFKVINARGKLSRFKHCPDLSPEKLNRTSGFVDILLGNDLCGLHPDKIANIDNLVILKSKFGTGYTLKGHHSNFIKFDQKTKEIKVNVCGVETLTRKENTKPHNDQKAKVRKDSIFIAEVKPQVFDEDPKLKDQSKPPSPSSGACPRCPPV